MLLCTRVSQVFRDCTVENDMPVGNNRSCQCELLEYPKNSLIALLMKRLRMICVMLPLSPTYYDAGFPKVTCSAFANAINGMAWWLHSTLECPNNVQHHVLLWAAVKGGHIVRVMRYTIEFFCTGKPN